MRTDAQLLAPGSASALCFHPMSYRYGSQDRNHATGAWRNVFWVCWRGETIPTAMAPMYTLMDTLISEYPDGIAMVTIVEESAPPPSADSRKAIAQLWRHVGHAVRGSIVAFEGEGFRASFVRGVVTSLTLLAKPPFPHRVFASVNAGAPWLIQQLPPSAEGKVQAADLVTGIAGLRARYNALYARMPPLSAA